jgi:PBSX family phage terminase large subunit
MALELQQFGKKSYDFITNPISKDARITILSGAVRSSKTWAMIPKTIALCDNNNPDIPKGLKLMAGASKDAVYDSVLRDIFEIVGKDAYHYNKSSGDLRLFDSMWKVMGADNERSIKYLLGKTLAVAYVNEGTMVPESFMRQLDFRLSVNNAKMYITTNPDSPFHYLYTDFINNDEVNENGAGLVRTIHYNLEDNPSLSEDYKASIRAMHSGVYYQRYIDGLWVIAEGVIYRDCWSDEENLFDDADININRSNDLRYTFSARYIGIDYGTTNPMVFLDVLDDGVTLWVFREYYWDSDKEKKQKTDAEYANDLVEFIGDRQDVEVIVDPSAASFKTEVIGKGLIIVDADNDVADGLRHTSSCFQKRIIRVHRRNCPNFLRERATYAWDPAKGKVGKEEPIKTNDHCMDNIRYVAKTKVDKWRLLLTI